MRYALLSALLLAVHCLQAAWTVDLQVCNAAGECQQLRAGVHSDASDGLDPQLGESNLPPWPPTSAFHARFLPDGLEGLLLDLRPDQPGTVDYLIAWQTGDAGGPVDLSWDPGQLPEFVDLVIQDPWGGSVQPPVNLRDTDHLSITLSALRRLILRAQIPDRPCAVSDLRARAHPAGGIILDWTEVTQSVSGSMLTDPEYQIWLRDPLVLWQTCTQPACTLWLDDGLPTHASIELRVVDMEE